MAGDMARVCPLPGFIVLKGVPFSHLRKLAGMLQGCQGRYASTEEEGLNKLGHYEITFSSAVILVKL